MKRVAKLIIFDENKKYLLLRRSNHPSFPNDPDLPGGTVEEGEAPLQALLREAAEEIGIVIDPHTVKKQYETDTYAATYTYYLYIANIGARPQVTISWEHAGYEWLDFDDFMIQASEAADSYMHMVYDALKQNNP